MYNQRKPFSFATEGDVAGEFLLERLSALYQETWSVFTGNHL
jgi:hypothetical protein